MARGALFALTLVVASLAVRAPLAAQGDADAIVGTWLTEEGDSRVEISGSGGTYRGKLVWLRAADGGAAPLDAKNSDSSLRSRALIGVDILSGFTYKGNQVWDGGKVYAPRRGSSYNGTLTLKKDGTLSVKARAGIGSRTVTWTRA